MRNPAIPALTRGWFSAHARIRLAAPARTRPPAVSAVSRRRAPLAGGRAFRSWRRPRGVRARDLGDERTQVSEELVDLVEHAADRARRGGLRDRRARLGGHRAGFRRPPEGAAADLTFLEVRIVVRAACGAQDQIQDVLLRARRLRLRLELGRTPRALCVARGDETAAVRADE